MFLDLTSVTMAAIIVGIAAIVLLVILAVFVGKTSPRIGFLGWITTWGDRFFIALLVFLYLSLVWMRFVEPFIPIYWALVLGIIIGTIIVKYG